MIINRTIKLLIALALGVVLTLVIWEAAATSVVANQDQLQRSRNVDAARWQAYGESILGPEAREAELIERSSAASAARWQALGEAYAARQALEAEQLQRSREASAARWQALGEYYLKLDQSIDR